MRILVVKLTSMGDALHLLPALTDLQAQFPAVQVDWMIEENFADIAKWHPAVNRVIPVATRRWRQLKGASISEFLTMRRELRNTPYDAIVDAQGLIKSALFARLARLNKGGDRIGLDAASVNEKPATLFYSRRVKVARDQHAITRLRQLFARTFAYSYNADTLDYQLGTINESAESKSESEPKPKHKSEPKPKSIAFLHATTWRSKHLPETLWFELAQLAEEEGYTVLLPWANNAEKERAERIAASSATATVLLRCTLDELKTILQTCHGAIAVDTGLGHLCAALGLRAVSIYGATNAKLTGAIGNKQTLIQTPYPCSPCMLKHCDKLEDTTAQPPCYTTLKASDIWSALIR